MVLLNQFFLHKIEWQTGIEKYVGLSIVNGYHAAYGELQLFALRFIA